MAEFGRWQWDDNGFWRDFTEVQQTAMEVAYRDKQQTCELSVHPVGVFIMDLQNMTQRAKSGRGAGFERKIRREVKKISVGYFLLGEDCDMFESDSPVDQIEDLPTLERLVDLLRKIIAEPTNFDLLSVDLSKPGNKETIGASPKAQEFLESRGFQVMEEVFMIFLHENVEPLEAALTEVEAALGRCLKRNAGGGSLPSQQAVQKPLVSSSSPSKHRARRREEALGEALRDQQFGARVLRGPDWVWGDQDGGAGSEGLTVQRWTPKGWIVVRWETGFESLYRVGAEGCYDLEVSRGRDDMCRIDDQGEDQRMFGDLEQPDEFYRADDSIVSQMVLEQLKKSQTDEFKVVLKLGFECREISLSDGCELEALLQKVKVAMPGLRLPHLSVKEREIADRPLFGLAAEPGRSLKEFAHLNSGDKVVVEDFEVAFVEKFQSGTLSLEELAMVAPLLDWDKPELMRLLMDRMRMLLEDSAPAKDWCKSAGVQMEEERRFGRALVCRLFKDKRLDERLEVCRKLLPVEQRAEVVVQVDRQEFMKTAMDSLAKLTAKELRGQLNVKFANEEGDDHGGPRRDFFVCFGERLAADLPGLWRRMGKGPIAPQPDDFSDSSPANQRSNMESEKAFRACGRAFALATKHGDVMGEDIASFFVHQVCRDHVVTLEVLQEELRQCDEDNYLASDRIRTQTVEESGLKGIKLTRTISGTQKEEELVPGGKDVAVTEENKMEWLELHLRHKLFHCLQRACDAFREGLLDVLGGKRNTCPWLALLTPHELADMWAGHSVTEDGLDRWRQVANVRPEVQQQADWFFNVLRESDDEKRGEVLKFCTGAQRFPRAGLKCFEIYPAEGGEQALPQAMTCANMLKLPRYSSEAVLKQQLFEAIKHTGDGFHYR